MQASKALSARFWDFWLLGGISIVAWFALAFVYLEGDKYFFFQQRLQQVMGTFALLSLVCNHPHFMASYFLAYGRGLKFCLSHWFSLVLLPMLIIGGYAFAYFHFGDSIIDARWAHFVNGLLKSLGIGFRLGRAANLGTEILGASVWLMYLTVGWHYSKQVFGCAMVYANYDSYPLSQNQRHSLKFAVFSVAFYSFCNLVFRWRDFGTYGSSIEMMGVAIGDLDLPKILELASQVGLFAGLVALFYFVFWRNYRRKRLLPSANFLVPIIAFYVWWVPLFPQKEYYFAMVPFFHSLQYLPFAFRMRDAKRKEGLPGEIRLGLQIVVLLAVGFLAFEAIPGLLDLRYFNGQYAAPVFFTLAFTVFINIHHFFIDSVLWRFKDPSIRAILLSAGDERRQG